jgi:formylglycine-generating enzyme required for sulfatase activity
MWQMPRARLPLVAVAALVVALATESAACSAILGIDARDYVGAREAGPSTGPDGSVASEGGTPPDDGGAVAPDASSCPGTAGAHGIRIDGGAVSFCIDATEVTRGEYARFLSTLGAAPPAQSPRCAWNASFIPTRSWPPQPFEEALPVVGVDWCDAYAFCAWAGKRLCGALGGGPVATSDSLDPSRSQWMYACTAAGTRKYAYGDTYDPTRCNTAGTGVVDAGSLPACVGGYPGIFDMSGNVEEWEDSCDLGDAGENDTCRLHGGSFNDGTFPANYACAVFNIDAFAERRSTTSIDLGLRCCSP